MITLACIRLATTPPEELVRPPPVQVDGLPNLFGACVYSYLVIAVIIDSYQAKTWALSSPCARLSFDRWFLPFAGTDGGFRLLSQYR